MDDLLNITLESENYEVLLHVGKWNEKVTGAYRNVYNPDPITYVNKSIAIFRNGDKAENEAPLPVDFYSYSSSDVNKYFLVGYLDTQPELDQRCVITVGFYAASGDSVYSNTARFGSNDIKILETGSGDANYSSYEQVSEWNLPYNAYSHNRWFSDLEEITVDCVDIPIFDSFDSMKSYVLSDGLTHDGVINLDDSYEQNETKTYYIYNQYGSGNILYGNVTQHSGTSLSWRSMRFMANAQPTLYFDSEDGFLLKISAREIVSSKATTGPGYTIDYIPETSWTEKALETTGPFYGTYDQYIESYQTTPEAGTYTIGFVTSTNIPIFKTKAKAEEALDTGDYSEAINFYDLDNKYYNPPSIGQAEDATTFGSGGVTSPFIATYVCDRNDVLNVANAFYSNDTSIIDNIKNGLELFGAEPFQAICGIKWFPCSLANVVTTAPQNYVYFGSYKYESATLSLNKVIGITSNGYIDAGTVTLSPIQNSFRSFEPYCGLSVFLPYIGWQKLRIADYWSKTVNVRYYLDIYTGSCIAALVANGVFVDYFTGNIGVELPVTGQMLSQYANSALNGLLGTAGGALGGAAGAAMLAGPQGLALGAGAAAAMAIGGAAVGAGSGIFKMAQKGAPKDHNTTKGSFTSSVGAYLPQYVMFRWEVHDLIIPDLLTDLYGRPSAASGKVSSFSGFLQCDTIKLNTSGMNDSEANEVAALLKEGVFV